MFQRLNHRLGHILLLLMVGASLFLVNLGGPSLWDLDEGRNATAALEMLESGDWIKPTFNGELRSHKPVLLCWLQALAYRQFGVNEFSARLPSALAALLTLLVTYELGRRMFNAATALFGSLILASTVSFCATAHFANPDALLNLFNALALFCFWQGITRERRIWFLLFGAASGLATLAKGPVGIVLPFGVIGVFLLWSRQLRWVVVRRLLLSLVPFLLVALPWYLWITAVTKGQFVREFFLTHNVARGVSAMENHRGPVYYYLLVLAFGFVPWSAFFGISLCSVWSAEREARSAERGPITFLALRAPRSALRFLLSWIAVYLLVFTLAATKLPNYVLPLYPALALLTAHGLERWRRGEYLAPAWLLHGSFACLALFGVGVTVALLGAGRMIEVAALRGRFLEGAQVWSVLGAAPVLGAAGAWWYWRRQQRACVLASLCVSAVLFLVPFAAWAALACERVKAPRSLVETAGALQRDEEIRIGGFRLEHLPSLNFYVQRDVRHLASEQEAANFLLSSLEVYLFVPAAHWEPIAGQIRCACRVVARHRDLYRGDEVVVITNR